MDSFQGIVEGAPFVDNVLYFPVALYGANKNALERMSDSGEGIDDALLLDGGLREEIRRCRAMTWSITLPTTPSAYGSTRSWTRRKNTAA